jgi:hypothetical protein
MTGPWRIPGPVRVPLEEMVAIDYLVRRQLVAVERREDDSVADSAPRHRTAGVVIGRIVSGRGARLWLEQEAGR